MDGVALLTIFVLSIFVGFEVVSKVSTVLHTPLMSGANAIHGIVLLGGITVAGSADGALELTLAVIAILLGAINLVDQIFTGTNSVYQKHPRIDHLSIMNNNTFDDHLCSYSFVPLFVVSKIL